MLSLARGRTRLHEQSAHVPTRSSRWWLVRKPTLRAACSTAASTDRSMLSEAREILDPPAVRAHQMVVVPGEILGELVARELVVRHDAVDDAGLLEHHEVAIRPSSARGPVPASRISGSSAVGRKPRARRRPAARTARHALLLLGEPPSDGLVQRAVAIVMPRRRRVGRPAYRRDASVPAGTVVPMEPAERFASLGRARPEPTSASTSPRSASRRARAIGRPRCRRGVRPPRRARGGVPVLPTFDGVRDDPVRSRSASAATRATTATRGTRSSTRSSSGGAASRSRCRC